MAIDSAVYSPKEFKAAIAYEDTTGTAETTGFTSLDVDSVGFPSLNPNQVVDVRTGGRVLKEADFFQSNKATVKEISLSGNAWSNGVTPFLTNLTNDTSSPYVVTHTYSPKEVKHGATSVSDFTSTFTLAIVSPEANSAMVFPGCVCTALSLSGDMGTESGRVKFSATIKTGYKPALSASDPTIGTLYSAGNQRYMTDWTVLRTVAGVADCILQSFTLNLENDAVMNGYQGTDGDPETIGRMSELGLTLDIQAKYDSQTEPLIASYETQSPGTPGAVTELSNNATWASASNFGILLSDGIMTNVAYSEGDSMMLDISQKATVAAGGTLFGVIYS